MKDTIAERLQELISCFCITQEELAISINVNKSNVNKWFREKAIPRKSSLREIAKIYKCNLRWLESGEGLMFNDTSHVPIYSDSYYQVKRDNERDTYDAIFLEPSSLSIIGKRVLEWLDGKPISYISEKIHISEDDIINCLKKDASPEAFILKQIAECFNKTLDELTHGNNIYDISATGENDEQSYSAKYKKLEDGVLHEAQEWINQMEKIRPGRKVWFTVEFENRFPEFVEWRQKKRAGNDH